MTSAPTSGSLRWLFVDVPAVLTYAPGGPIHITDLARGWSCSATGVVADAALRALDGQPEAPLLRQLGAEHPLRATLRRLIGQRRLELTPASAVRLGGFDTLFVELTGACNERCIHCYAECGPDVQTALDRATCEAVLDDAAALGFARVQFTGGDPLLCDFLPELLARATALGIGAREIYTNGLALTDRLLSRLACSSPSLAFSFYARDPAQHDAITRTPGSHRRTSAAIERALSRGLTVRVAIIVMPSNAALVPATIDYLRELGVSAIGVSPTHGVGRGVHYGDALHSAPASAGGGKTERAPAPDSSPPGGEAGEAVAALPAGKLCVAFDGRVLPCIFNRNDVLGRVPEQRLQAIAARPAVPAGGNGRRESWLGGFREQLQCWSCQLTACVLRQAAQSP